MRSQCFNWKNGHRLKIGFAVKDFTINDKEIANNLYDSTNITNNRIVDAPKHISDNGKQNINKEDRKLNTADTKLYI